MPQPSVLHADPIVHPSLPGGRAASRVGRAARGGPAVDGVVRARRILMVAPTSFFADYGCHVRILEEARALRRLGQQVTIVTYYTGRDVDGLDIRRTLPIPWRRHYEVGSSRHKVAFDVLLAARAAVAATATRPDVVHGHLHEGALVGAAVARALRRPLVFDYQGSLSGEMVDHGFLDPAGPFYRPVRALERTIDRMPDALVTSSHNAAAQLAASAAVDPWRIRALPDCVNADTFRPGLLAPAARRAALSVLGIPAERRVVVYLGLLARHQGTYHLLEAARDVVARRPDTHFLIMGFPGPHVFQARAAALGLAGHTTFTGRVPYEDAPARLALGDVAVAPKLSATEGSGKILNYMAMGLPTVAFETPVSREYLLADGYYARVGNAADLADRIVEALSDPSAEARAGRLRLRAVEVYDWRHAGSALLDVYDRAIARRARAAGLVGRGAL